jgi:hypothetical protein
MRTKALLGILALASALAFVGPADAITVNGVDYALFARCKIGMENGPISITGPNANVAVSEICGAQNGFLHIGVNNVIEGTAIANNMFFSNGASVGTCNFNNSTGGNPGVVCGAQNSPVPPPFNPITAWPPLPVPVVTLSATSVLCPPTCNPAPGNYRDIRAKDGASLNLAAGTYNARNVLIESGATLAGAGVNATFLNLTGVFNTEPGANINDIMITSILGQGLPGIGSSTESIETGNGTQVQRAVFYAPFSRMHLHQGSTYDTFEGIAVLITVEPITITGGDQAICACVGTIQLVGTTVELRQGCHLNLANLTFFLAPAPNCPTNPAACPGCTMVTRLPGASDTQADLDVTGVAAGQYRVVVQSSGGSYCTAQTVTVP